MTLGTNGDDILTLGYGAMDDVDGLAGNDTLLMDQSTFSREGFKLDFGADPSAGWTLFHPANSSSNTSSLITSIEFIQFGDITFSIFAGSAGADVLDASSAANAVLIGGDGNDTFIGSAGGDIMYSGAGADILSGNGGADDYRIRDGQIGDFDGDVISDYDANDFLVFEGLSLSIANFTFTQDPGFLTIDVDIDFDSVIDATLTLTGDFTAVLPDFRIQFLNGGATALTFGPSEIDGTVGNDVMTGTIRSDVLNGGDGDDVINGGVGNDTVSGGLGVDIMTGGAGDDNFSFQNLADAGVVADHITDFEIGDSFTLGMNGATAEDPDLPIIFIGTGAFTVLAGEVRYSKGGGVTLVEMDSDGDGIADHRIQLDNGEFDLRQGGPASPTFEIDAASGFESAFDDSIAGSSGDDVINSGDGNDSIRGMGGNDTINAGAGDDFISGFGGTDIIDGGDGTDSFQSFFAGQVSLTITDGSIVDAISGDSVTLISVEGISLTNRLALPTDDIMDASATTIGVRLFGGAGDDILIGGSGDDALEGDRGADTLTGGLGNDRFTFDFSPEISTVGAGDVITDFELGDTVEFTFIELFFETFPEMTDITFVGDAAFSGFAGEYRFEASGGQTLIQFDFDGDMAADRTVTLSNGEFTLIDNGTVLNRLVMQAGDVPTPGDDNIIGTNGDDVIDALGGDDFVQGLAGNDTISGGDGDDTLWGGDGDDLLSGGVGNDTIDGGNGDDQVFGEDGDDTLSGGAGDDAVLGGDGNDTADGGDGDDFVFGGNGDDTLFGGAGNDLVRGDDGNDVLDGGDGDDRLDGGAGVDTLTGGAGCDTFRFDDLRQAGIGANADIITDLELGDNIQLGRTSSTLADPGVDLLTFIGTAAFSGVMGEYRYDKVGGQTIIQIDTDGDGVSDSEIIIANGEFDLRQSIGAGPRLEIDGAFGVTTAGDDKIFGTSGNDVIDGDDGDDVLRGMDGDDVVNGGAGDDFIRGGAGNDIIDGGDGEDAFVYFGNSQVNLVITDTSIVNSLTGETDTLSNIERIAYTNRLAAPSDDVMDASAATITVQLHGGMGDDILIGGSGDDDIEGDIGNDIMTGGLGADLFNYDYLEEFELGGDVITDFEVGDRVAFTNAEFTSGIDLQFISDGAFSGVAGEFRFEASGGQTIIEFDLDGNTVVDSFVTITNGEFTLVEGALDSNSLIILSDDPSSGDDVILGTNGDDVIDALEGDDKVSGLGGNDILNGGDGDDTLNGDDGDDILFGDDGNDTLNGGDGDDTLHGDAGVDTLTGGAGCDSFLFDDLSDTGVGANADVITDLEPGDSIRLGLTSGTNQDPGADLLVFIGTDAFSGTAGEHRYEKTGGQTIIQIDTVGDGIADSEIIIANGEFDLRSVGGAGPTLEINAAFGVTTAGDDKIYGSSGDDVINGGDGNDSLRGMAGDDIINGGDGDDFISENTGNDTIDGGAGFDRVSRFNDTQVNVTIADSMISDSISGEVDLITNIERVAYSQRLAAPSDDIMDASAATIQVALHGGAGDDILIGGSGDDNLEGDAGNDTMTGGLGADRFTFDYTSEFGLTGDVITDFEGGDTIEFTLIEHFTEAFDLTFIDTAAFSGVAGEYRYFTGGGQTVVELDLDGDTVADRTVTLTNGEFTLVDQSPDFHRLVIQSGVPTPNDDILVGTNGADVIGALAGDDFVQGLAGDDTLIGNDGNDILWGGDGDDVFIAGAGSDIIDGGDGQDILSYAGASAGVNVFDLSDGTTIFGPDGDETVTSIEGIIGSDFQDFIFLPIGTTEMRSLFIDGGAGDDFIRGGHGDDEIHGGTGNDSLRGNDGDDQLFGGDGDDHLRSDHGVDTIDGGAGSDRISFFNLDATQGAVSDLRTGITSNDGLGNVETFTSIENLGAGTAFVDIYDGDDNDNLLFAMGAGDIMNGHGGDDLILADSAGIYDGGAGVDTINMGGDQLVVDNDSDGFADFVTRTAGVVLNLQSERILDDGFGGSGRIFNFENASGTEFDDDIRGSNGDNVLSGNGGNDLLRGRNGDDTLNGGDGDDDLRGDNGDDVLDGGDGNDILRGGRNDDSLSGGTGDDILRGDRGDDTLDGGDGNDDLRGSRGEDTLIGSAGNDELRGGHDDDILDGGDGDDVLRGDRGDDVLNGGAGNDDLRGSHGDDTLDGGDGNDMLRGGRGDDVLNGGAGDDDLRGGRGDDKLAGGEGDDIMRGNQGDDVFVFALGDDADTITGFEEGSGIDDVIEISGFGTAFDTFTELMAIATQVGNHTVFDFGGGDTLTVNNVDISDFDADDFVFI